ncbi:MAG: hypothetical protein M3355_11905 [Actinomycetota bacterium]|nr:hypothetical protein [Actinomycetota bacterium]
MSHSLHVIGNRTDQDAEVVLNLLTDAHEACVGRRKDEAIVALARAVVLARSGEPNTVQLAQRIVKAAGGE